MLLPSRSLSLTSGTYGSDSLVLTHSHKAVSYAGNFIQFPHTSHVVSLCVCRGVYSSNTGARLCVCQCVLADKSCRVKWLTNCMYLRRPQARKGAAATTTVTMATNEQHQVKHFGSCLSRRGETTADGQLQNGQTAA